MWLVPKKKKKFSSTILVYVLKVDLSVCKVYVIKLVSNSLFLQENS